MVFFMVLLNVTVYRQSTNINSNNIQDVNMKQIHEKTPVPQNSITSCILSPKLLNIFYSPKSRIAPAGLVMI